MAILPIDIQVMLSHMDQVSREQAAQREGTPHAQAAQASELVKQAEQADHSVNQSRQLGDGSDKIQNKKERNKRRGRKAQGDAAKARDDEAEKQKAAGRNEEVFEDPALGRHVDLIG